MQSDAMAEAGPWKSVDLQFVVQLEGAASDFLDRVGLLDRIEIVAHMVDAAARRRDDIVEAGEVAHKQGLSVGAIGIETGIGHRLGAAALIPRIGDVQAEPLQQLEGRDADLGREGVDEAGNEKSDAHGMLLSSGLMSGKSCP